MLHHILPETLNSQKIQHCFNVYTILSKLPIFLMLAKLFIQCHLPTLEECKRGRWLKLVFLFPRTELPQLMLHTLHPAGLMTYCGRSLKPRILFQAKATHYWMSERQLNKKLFCKNFPLGGCYILGYHR